MKLPPLSGRAKRLKRAISTGSTDRMLTLPTSITSRRIFVCETQARLWTNMMTALNAIQSTTCCLERKRTTRKKNTMLKPFMIWTTHESRSKQKERHSRPRNWQSFKKLRRGKKGETNEIITSTINHISALIHTIANLSRHFNILIYSLFKYPPPYFN